MCLTAFFACSFRHIAAEFLLAAQDANLRKCSIARGATPRNADYGEPRHMGKSEGAMCAEVRIGARDCIVKCAVAHEAAKRTSKQ